MISAIILAAGEASRLGECKQLAALRGKTILGHVLENLNRSSVDEIVAVLGAREEVIRQEVAFLRATTIVNRDHAQGMSTSIQAGLRALSSGVDAVMVVLADQPFVSTKTFDRLSDRYRRERPSIVVPTYKGLRGNPVVIDRALFPEMMELRGDIGCRAMFHVHAASIVEVPVDDRGVVTDIDTAEDLEAARNRWSLREDEQEWAPHVL